MDVLDVGFFCLSCDECSLVWIINQFRGRNGAHNILILRLVKCGDEQNLWGFNFVNGKQSNDLTKPQLSSNRRVSIR